MIVEATAQTQPSVDFFVFGDSLSDIGNLFAKTLRRIPPSPDYFEGRFSNGSLAVEILAQDLGLPLSLKTNFAIGGARTDRTNNVDDSTFGLIQFGGLLTQIDSFQSQAAELGAGAEDLYLVWAGGNDFLNLIDNPANPTAVVTAAVTNILTSVRSLAAAGAKNIVVAQTPNLGRVPLSLEAGQLQSLTQLSVAFNTALAAALNQFEQAAPDKNIILTDLFTPIESVAQNPSTFGFTNVTDPLKDTAGGNANQFFFWDDAHPTTRGHGVFAEAFRAAIVTGINDNLTRSGSATSDRLVTFAGRDTLNGRKGDDYLEANGRQDVLLGGDGDDVLLGGDGNDRLTGGAGRDQLTGGAGRDRFIYTGAGEGRDTITDFETERDRIDLTEIFDRRVFTRPNRFEAYVRLGQTTEGTIVRVDTNGNLRGGFKTMTLLSDVNAGDLSAANFQVSG
ncbi:type I secretion C-terminal target domain-containing protein [Microcoleus sp. FACHB-1515]|uniref:SGNH/GDSL hydrolase family protein n=1 Tax=Cyanophyceae TaxID=3028117 RepID=UPI001687DC79|nr:SGNH/GDSL hydrolase family protein [Microcoleus sp. FACHB-1515]MBD2088425.1 type I secretion C-terminal target domain-containing protein [Microcoleus sp. FACHB-1515]